MVRISGKFLLRAIAYTVFGFGIVTILQGILATGLNGRGIGVQIVVGVVHMALALWLLKGSQVARAILAFLFCLTAIVGFFFAAAFGGGGNIGIAIIFGGIGLVAAFYFWALGFSKELKAELERVASASKKKTADATAGRGR